MIIQEKRISSKLVENHKLFPNTTFFPKSNRHKKTLLTSYKQIQRETVEFLESIQIHDTEDLKELFSDPNSRAIIDQIGLEDWNALEDIVKKYEANSSPITLPNDLENLFMYLGADDRSNEWIMSIYWNDLLLTYQSDSVRSLVNNFQKIVKKLYPIKCYYIAPEELSVYLPKNHFNHAITDIKHIETMIKEYGFSLPEKTEEYPLAIALLSRLTNGSNGA